METTEKIVEAYCRYVRGWFTIPNIKCSGQYEIDLLAIDPSDDSLKRYHIESGVSISRAYSKLTGNEFSVEKLHQRVQQSGQRRTIGYFAQRKFGAAEIRAQLEKYGFRNGNYRKIIATWGWNDEAKTEAQREGIVLWDFRDLLNDLADLFKGNRCQGRSESVPPGRSKTVPLSAAM